MLQQIRTVRALGLLVCLCLCLSVAVAVTVALPVCMYVCLSVCLSACLCVCVGGGVCDQKRNTKKRNSACARALKKEGNKLWS
jgi:hypothetical protein